jgi:hypothetical protein
MQKAQGKCCENQPLSRNRELEICRFENLILETPNLKSTNLLISQSSRNTAFLPKPEPPSRKRQKWKR